MNLSKIKLLFFENQFNDIKPSIDIINPEIFDDRLEYRVLQRSQELAAEQDLRIYDVIFIDIDLSKHSEMDGYSLIKEIENQYGPSMPIVILSGHSKDEKQIEKLGIGNYPYLTKQIDFEEFTSVVNSIILK